MRSEKWFFLRGLVREQGHWAGFLEAFEAEFPHREAIGLDLPGNGARFKERSPATIEALTESARGEFLKRRGEKNFIFSISLGSMVTVDWMCRHPGEIEGAVLGNTSMKGLSPFYRRMMPAAYGTILQILCARDPLLKERLILELTSKNPAVFGKLEKEWAEIRIKHPVSIANSFRQILAALQFRPPEAKPEGKILILSGGADTFVSPACSAAIARHWQVPIAVHPEAGHDITLDARDWVLEQLRSYF